MKNLSVFLITFLFTCISFSAILYISCSKAKDSCSGVSCLNSGSCVNGICNCPSGYVGSHCEKSSIYFKNNAYTSIKVTINYSTVVVKSNDSVRFDGVIGSTITGTAYTYPYSDTFYHTSGVYHWNISSTCPSSGSISVPLDVDSSYFCLIINNYNVGSSASIYEEYVNYGLASQTKDSVYVSATNPYNIVIGYYRAFSNSNVKVNRRSDTSIIQNITLSGTKNQYYIAQF